MILLFFLLGSLSLLLLRGGLLSDLGRLRFRHAWMILGSCGVQLGVMYALPLTEPWAAARGPLIVLAYTVLVVGLAANWRLPWLPMLAAGAVLNFAAIAANGGLMPVTPEALVQARMTHQAPGLEPGTPVAGTKDVVLPREQTRLWVLSDIFIWPRLPRHAVFSIGDVLIALGGALMIQSVRPLRSARRGVIGARTG